MLALLQMCTKSVKFSVTSWLLIDVYSFAMWKPFSLSSPEKILIGIDFVMLVVLL